MNRTVLDGTREDRGAGSANGDGGEHALRLSALHKRFGQQVAVEEISLDIREGEFMTLLGASGSGKTTTLMMIAGFERPTSGAIILNGTDLTGVAPQRRGIGVVFQSYALFPHLTVRDNVAYPLRMRGTPRAERGRLVTEALEQVQLTDFADRRPRQLSGGQQQRVALARALVFHPPLLLMDEPLGALDKKLREHMQDEIHRLHQQFGVTVVYVTHDQNEALALSDRIAVMRDGRVEQVGAPREIYDRPRTVFVADFVGRANLLAGGLVGRDRDIVSVRLDGRHVVSAVAPEQLADGARVVIAVRPERLRLAPDRASATAGNVIPVTLVSATFLGSTIRYEARAEAGGAMLTLEMLSGGGAVPEVGARVHACWDTADGIALAPGPSEPSAAQDGRAQSAVS